MVLNYLKKIARTSENAGFGVNGRLAKGNGHA